MDTRSTNWEWKWLSRYLKIRKTRLLEKPQKLATNLLLETDLHHATSSASKSKSTGTASTKSSTPTLSRHNVRPTFHTRRALKLLWIEWLEPREIISIYKILGKKDKVIKLFMSVSREPIPTEKIWTTTGTRSIRHPTTGKSILCTPSSTTANTVITWSISLKLTQHSLRTLTKRRRAKRPE